MWAWRMSVEALRPRPESSRATSSWLSPGSRIRSSDIFARALDVVKRSTREREQVRVTLTGAEAAVPTERNRTAEAERMDALGIDVGSSRPEACRQVERPAGVDGVWIRSVTPRGPVARTLGNARCLIIQDVNGQTVSNVAEYERAIADLGPGDVANLLLYNPQSGTNLVVTVPIPNSR